jgi:hypothetical protein
MSEIPSQRDMQTVDEGDPVNMTQGKNAEVSASASAIDGMIMVITHLFFYQAKYIIIL